MKRGHLPCQLVRAEIGEQVKLRVAGGRRAKVGEVEDVALRPAFDRGVGAVDEALQAFGEPMIAARLFAIARNAGYRGYFSMEADTSGDPYANTQELAQATLKYLAS